MNRLERDLTVGLFSSVCGERRLLLRSPDPIAQPEREIGMRKRYRIYFNRERDWPQCWSVDEGDQSSEINVCGFEIQDCEVRSALLTPELRAGVDGRRAPYAWLEVTGVLELAGGHAVFTFGGR